MSYLVAVTEDHADTRELLVKFLKRKGIHVVACNDGTQALQVMRAQKPDVVVLDQAMPGMTGLETYRVMKEDPSLAGISVVFYSASFEASLVAEALEMGAEDWLVKGVHSLERLMLAVDRANIRKFRVSKSTRAVDSRNH